MTPAGRQDAVDPRRLAADVQQATEQTRGTIERRANNLAGAFEQHPAAALRALQSLVDDLQLGARPTERELRDAQRALDEITDIAALLVHDIDALGATDAFDPLHALVTDLRSGMY